MKNAGIGMKIGLGFALLIAIAVILGSMAVYYMKTTEKESDILAQEYVPEVAVAMELGGAANRTMYEMRGYGFTEEEQYYDLSLKEMAEMEAALQKAVELEAVSPHLTKLKKQIEKATTAVETYKALMQQTVQLNQKLKQNRADLEKTGEVYMSNCARFLDKQNQLFETDADALNADNHETMKKTFLERHRKITITNDIIDLGNMIRINASKSLAQRDPDLLKKTIQKFSQVNDKLAEIRAVSHQKSNLDIIDTIQKAGTDYQSALSELLSNWLESQDVATQRTQTGNQVIAACGATSDAGILSTNKIAKRAAESLGSASTIMIIGLIAALIIGILSAYFIIQAITKPVTRITQGMSEGAEQVAAASGQVSSASQSMAEGASEQAASIEETSSSMEEMSAMTNQNAQNANQADALMKETNQVVATANGSMNELTHSMEEISQASEETSKIIKTIDEIAFQTNLLALNAAVEAARAGEAGAGFAVVADEVRNLAMRAAEAAKSTAELIEGTVKKVEEGSELVASTNEAFGQVATSSGKVGALISEISQASKEQSEGISQVNKAIGEMDQIVQQNASNAEESASAAEEMNAQAEQLKDFVQELVKMVSGKEIARNADVYRSPTYSTQSRPKAIGQGSSSPKRHGKKLLSKGGSHEVNPSQVIPFDDDDDDFSDF